MEADPIHGTDHRVRHAIKLAVLIAYLLFIIILPFLQVIFPDSHLVQFLLGGNRWMLVVLLTILLAFPSARREMERRGRSASDPRNG
jgi:Na+/melibiose symporter-like transporter